MEHLLPKDQKWCKSSGFPHTLSILYVNTGKHKRSKRNIPMYLHMHAVVKQLEFMNSQRWHLQYSFQALSSADLVSNLSLTNSLATSSLVL